MNSNHAISYPIESERDFGKSYAMKVYDAIINDPVMKDLYRQRMITLDNRVTTQLKRTGPFSWAINLFSKEEAEQFEKINKELQERYETLIQDIIQRRSA